MRKAVWWLVILSVVGGAGWWFVIKPYLHTTTGIGKPAIATTLAPTDAQILEKALNSADLHTQASVMAPDLAAAYLTHGHNFLPSGATLRLKPETMIVSGNAASVEASMTGGVKSTTYVLTLIGSDKTWKLQDTQEKR